MDLGALVTQLEDLSKQVNHGNLACGEQCWSPRHTR
jgi:hypothetical protein